MAKKKKKKTKLLTFFVDHEDQEASDLEYGGQKECCKPYAKRDTAFVDRSIGRDWRPDED